MSGFLVPNWFYVSLLVAKWFCVSSIKIGLSLVWDASAKMVLCQFKIGLFMSGLLVRKMILCQFVSSKMVFLYIQSGCAKNSLSLICLCSFVQFNGCLETNPFIRKCSKRIQSFQKPSNHFIKIQPIPSS
jgi:hypothetical protein